jgi:hypothetical protein
VVVRGHQRPKQLPRILGFGDLDAPVEGVSYLLARHRVFVVSGQYAVGDLVHDFALVVRAHGGGSPGVERRVELGQERVVQLTRIGYGRRLDFTNATLTGEKGQNDKHRQTTQYPFQDGPPYV